MHLTHLRLGSLTRCIPVQVLVGTLLLSPLSTISDLLVKGGPSCFLKTQARVFRDLCRKRLSISSSYARNLSQYFSSARIAHDVRTLIHLPIKPGISSQVDSRHRCDTTSQEIREKLLLIAVRIISKGFQTVCTIYCYCTERTSDAHRAHSVA